VIGPGHRDPHLLAREVRILEADPQLGLARLRGGEAARA